MAETGGAMGRRKVLVPEDGPAALARPRLEDRLEEAARRRVTLVTAAPGMGKTTLLAAWARRRRGAWYTVGADDRNPEVLARGILEAARQRVPSLDPDAVAPPPAGDGLAIPSEGQESLAADEVLGMLTEHLDRDLTLVLDDVHELGDSALSGRLVGDLVRGAPRGLHIVLSSRGDPPFGVARLRAQGHALDLPGSDLRFTAVETAATVETILGHVGDDVAASVHEHTAGWPTAVRVIAEWLRLAPRPRWGKMVPHAADPGGPLEAFVVEEVISATPERVLELLRAVASLDRFTAPLAAEFVGPGGEELVTLLARDGLWIVPERDRHGSYFVPPLLRRVLQSRLALGAADSAIAVRRAAAWMEGRGETRYALGGLLAGAVSTVVPVPAAAPYIEAGAKLFRGDYDAALALLEPEVSGEGPVPMSAGLVAGLVRHFRGELHEAMAMYERALVGPGNDALRAMVLGWAASAAWLTGDGERCRRMTAETVVSAQRSQDDRALAMAHTALGMLAAFDGDRRAMQHYERPWPTPRRPTTTSKSPVSAPIGGPGCFRRVATKRPSSNSMRPSVWPISRASPCSRRSPSATGVRRSWGSAASTRRPGNSRRPRPATSESGRG